ncbi:MAG: hypothetical protein ABIH23_00030 [bacterium]
MDWVLYGALTLLNAVLLWWILILKREMRDIRRIVDDRQPRKTLSEEDLEALQKSLSALVETLETYTEDSLAEMRQQVAKIQEMTQDHLRQGIASERGASRPARSIRIRPDSSSIEHREKEKIIALHRHGKSVQEISRELHVTAGEVELVIGLLS